MLKNYLKISFRKLWKEKGYAFLNIFGLAVGITVSLLIGLYIFDELGYDSFFKQSDQIYRVQFEHEFGGKVEMESTIPEMIGPNLSDSYPEVEKAVRITGPYDNSLIEIEGKQFYQSGFISADSSFFDLFTYEALHGNLETALYQPGSLVLTESLAEKIFGTTDVVGNRLTLRNSEHTITAVIVDVPHNTHLQFSMVGYRESSGRKAWNYRSADTYILLKDQASVDQLQEKMPSFIEQYAYRSAGQGLEKADAGNYNLYFQELTDIHLNPQGFGTQQKAGPWQYLYILACVAILILAIACINYTNISTARSAQQAREVCVRKTVGANREQLISRFLTESILSSSLATLLAIFMLEAVLPYFNNFVGKELQLFGFEHGVVVFIGLIALVLLVGILSGGYGALVISSFRPATVLKGSMLAGIYSGSGFRKALVTIQFTASVGLILITVLIYQQMDYVRENRLNQNDEQIVVLENYRQLTDQYGPFRQQLMSYSEVELVSTGQKPGTISSRMVIQDSTGNRTEILNANVGYGYSEILGLDVLSGRSFSPDFPDSNAFIVNQSAAEEWLGVEQASGQETQGTYGRLVGIVEDFHMLPLYEPIQPMIMRFDEKAQRHILVKLKGGQIASGLDRIHQAWTEFVPSSPPLYSFLDDELDKAYRSELRMANIFGGFSLIAIFLACLGLFGLSAYSAHRRVKEIGIRKVFGASISNLVALLSKDFMKLVILGFLISTPIAYYIINRWLTDFKYKIEIDPWIFIGTGVAVALLALATVSWQSIRAAVANPADSLRQE